MNHLYQTPNIVTNPHPFHGKRQMPHWLRHISIPDDNLNNLLGKLAGIPDGHSGSEQIRHILSNDITAWSGREIFS
jgi:hypothetical protein